MATKATTVAGLNKVSLRPAYSNGFAPLKSSFVSYGGMFSLLFSGFLAIFNFDVVLLFIVEENGIK